MDAIGEQPADPAVIGQESLDGPLCRPAHVSGEHQVQSPVAFEAPNHVAVGPELVDLADVLLDEPVAADMNGDPAGCGLVRNRDLPTADSGEISAEVNCRILFHGVRTGDDSGQRFAWSNK